MTESSKRATLAAVCGVFAVVLLGGCTVKADKTEPDSPVVSRAPGSVVAVPDADVDALWKDPGFRKQFVAGYGVNSEIEPRLTPEEVKVLDTIRPMMANNLPGAEAALTSHLKNDSSATLFFTLGSIQFQQDKMTEALGNYEKAVSKFPNFKRAWRNIGLIDVRAGKYDDAIHAFTKMIELGGGDGYAYGLLAMAYSAKQDYQAAETAYRQALLLQPESTDWRLGLTRCVLKQGKYEDAISLLASLLAKYPDKADFWSLQALAYIGSKQPLKAAENYEMLDRLGKATADNLHSLGDIYVTENLMDPAARAYQRAMDVDEKQPIAKPLRDAELLVSRGAIPQAREVTAHIRSLWEKQMEDADRRKLLKLEARLSMAEGGGNEETAKVLEEITKLDPLDGEAFMMLGQHYAKQNDPNRAIMYYEHAEKIDAFEYNAKVRHAQTLVSMGNYSDAIPLLRRAQEIKPRDDIARYLEQIERAAKARK